MYPVRGVSLRHKSKLVAEEESMSYFNLAMGKDCESQPVLINADDQVHKAIRKMCFSFLDSREGCHIHAWTTMQADANIQRQKMLAEAAAIRLNDILL